MWALKTFSEKSFKTYYNINFILTKHCPLLLGPTKSAQSCPFSIVEEAALQKNVIMHASSLVPRLSPHAQEPGNEASMHLGLQNPMCCTPYWNGPYQLAVSLKVTSDTLPDLRVSEVSCKHLLTKAQQAAKNELRTHVCSKWTLLGKLNYLFIVISIVVSRLGSESRYVQT